MTKATYSYGNGTLHPDASKGIEGIMVPEFISKITTPIGKEFTRLYVTCTNLLLKGALQGSLRPGFTCASRSVAGLPLQVQPQGERRRVHAGAEPGRAVLPARRGTCSLSAPLLYNGGKVDFAGLTAAKPGRDGSAT